MVGGEKEERLTTAHRLKWAATTKLELRIERERKRL
jgi:hypothetical protein